MLDLIISAPLLEGSPYVYFSEACTTTRDGTLSFVTLGREGTFSFNTTTELSGAISRLHAVVTRDKHNVFYITDACSTNGTFFNKERLPARLPRRIASAVDTVFLGGEAELIKSGTLLSNPYMITFTFEEHKAGDRSTASSDALRRGRKRPNNVVTAQERQDALMNAISCAVCQDPLYSAVSLKCGHALCASCAHTWLSHKPSCPQCRTTCGINDTRPVSALSAVAEEVARSHGDRAQIARLDLRKQHDAVLDELRDEARRASVVRSSGRAGTPERVEQASARVLHSTVRSMIIEFVTPTGETYHARVERA